MPKVRKPEEHSVDPSAIEMLKFAEEFSLGTAFSRADTMQPCPIGADGLCCKNCFMGPCRVVKDGQTGVCGATVDTIVARNFARGVAAGASAHSDHGRDMAFTLKAAATGEASDYKIRDPYKLFSMAKTLGVPLDGRSVEEIASDVADIAMAQFGQQTGEVAYVKRAPAKRQKIWRELGYVPRGIDREVVELLHRTHIGDDQEAEHILESAVRCALADGWGGSMLATDISDVLFGTPSPLVSQANLGVLKEDEVNIIVHGHEPTLSEMIVAAAGDPELVEYAHSKGAKGINLSGICCTANETLMRQGVPLAGNFLNQELAILTGAVEAMVVDVQCIMQAIAPLSENFHTEVITTSKKVKISGATHIEFDEHHAMDIAKRIVRRAIDKFPERGKTHIPVHIPDDIADVVPGFSHEYINYALGGVMRGSFRPLNDAIMAGRIRGVVANIGCNNPRVKHDELHQYLVQEFLKNDVLVVETGCGAIASAKQGLMLGEAGLEHVGPGLREVCEAVGMPPVLHLGSCVDNARILTVLTQMASEGGLGDDISDIPAVGLAPEWMSEKALSIATYCVASGAYVIMGVTNPVKGSEEVMRLMKEDWGEKLGGRLEFITDPDEILQKTLAYIDERRAALKLPEYDASKWGQSGDERMLHLVELPFAERQAAMYGEVA
jgi:carbon-monoxide dehydrogenase catalytic subunit